MIYIARIGALIKVGYTGRSVTRRLREHARHYGVSPVLICSAEGGRQTERILHRKLEPFRVRRERAHGAQSELFDMPDVVLGFVVGFMVATLDAEAILNSCRYGSCSPQD